MESQVQQDVQGDLRFRYDATPKDDSERRSTDKSLMTCCLF